MEGGLHGAFFGNPRLPAQPPCPPVTPVLLPEVTDGALLPQRPRGIEQNHTGGMHMPRDVPDAHMRAHASLGADDQMPLEQD